MGTDRRRAVFLDRDGVINQNVFNPATGEYEAPLIVQDFALVPGVQKALLRLQTAGFLLFLVSNQPNYAKGKSTLSAIGKGIEPHGRALTSNRTQSSLRASRRNSNIATPV